MKPWIANLSFIILLLVLIGISFIIGIDAVECLIDGDFSGYIDEMVDLINYVSIVGILIVVMSILYLVIKPLRTKFTRFWSICNIIWITILAGLMYLSN